jgi:hypothetical protein
MPEVINQVTIGFTVSYIWFVDCPRTYDLLIAPEHKLFLDNLFTYQVQFLSHNFNLSKYCNGQSNDKIRRIMARRLPISSGWVYFPLKILLCIPDFITVLFSVISSVLFFFANLNVLVIMSLLSALTLFF